MKNQHLEKRFQSTNFQETEWTASSKNIGEYIFRRISMDQSNKKLQEVRPRHIMSQLIINSSEINAYVNDYLKMVDRRNNNIETVSKGDSSKKDYPIQIQTIQREFSTCLALSKKEKNYHVYFCINSYYGGLFNGFF